MSNKPGIFDPWRQQPKPAGAETNAAPAMVDDERKLEERCVTYAGKNAGINVWIDAADAAPERTAIQRVRELFEALRELKDPAVVDALKSAGLDTAVQQADAETAAMVIRRALVRSPRAAALIAQKKIKAFVK